MNVKVLSEGTIKQNSGVQEREEGEAEPEDAVGHKRHAAIVWRTPPKKARVDGAAAADAAGPSAPRSRAPSASATPQPAQKRVCCLRPDLSLVFPSCGLFNCMLLRLCLTCSRSLVSLWSPWRFVFN